MANEDIYDLARSSFGSFYICREDDKVPNPTPKLTAAKHMFCERCGPAAVNLAAVATRKAFEEAAESARRSKADLVAVLEVILMQLDGPPTEMIGAVFDGRELERARDLLAKEKQNPKAEERADGS